MTMRVVDDVLNASCDAAVDLVDGGGGANGVIEFYTGTPPANPTDAPGGTLLASVDYQNPAFGDAGASNAGEAEALGTPLNTTGADDGTIGWARVVNTGQDDAGVLWDDDDVGTSGNSILVNTTTVSSGVDFAVTSHTVTVAPAT